NGGLGTLKAGLPVGGGNKIKYGGGGNEGSRVSPAATTNLESPANRAAFAQASVTAGPVALPKPTPHYVPTGGVAMPNPVELGAPLAPLGGRFDKDAVYVRSEYDTGQLGGTIGASGEGFGLDGTYKGTNADLTK